MSVPTECPDYKPDPYTGRYPMTHCLVMHYKTETKEMSRSFHTRQEAEAFVDGAPENIKPLMKILEEGA